MKKLDPSPVAASVSLSPYRWVFEHIFRYKLLLSGIIIASFFIALLAAAMPVLTGVAFDAVLETPPNFTAVGWAALWIIISQVVRAFLGFGRVFISGVLGERLERDTRDELYVSLLQKSMTFHDKHATGELMARATNDVHEINLMFSVGFNLIIGSINFVIIPVLLSPRYYPTLIIAPLFFVVTFALAQLHYLKMLRPVAEQVRQAFGKMNSRLVEAIDGIEFVKGAVREEQEMVSFTQNALRHRDTTNEQGEVEARFFPFLLLGLTQGFGFAQALFLLQDGLIEVGDIIAYMGLLFMLGAPTFVGVTAFSRLSSGFAAVRRVLELIQADEVLDLQANGYSQTMAGHIRFENVSFGYYAEEHILNDISFAAKPGQTIAIVGQTGAGKTSLVKLINRTYDVNQGRIFIDGVDIREWDLASLRQQISMIEQDIFLFSRSIAENIAFGHPNATPQIIEEAAKQAQAHEFIMAFKDGYETIVGERGMTLSGGQRQRIALARAFLTKPRILILDDSTSAVDSATEDMIQRAIMAATLRQTTILITHRLSQIRRADLVLILSDGCLAAYGTHDTLIRVNPSYRRIFTDTARKTAQPGAAGSAPSVS